MNGTCTHNNEIERRCEMFDVMRQPPSRNRSPLVTAMLMAVIMFGALGFYLILRPPVSIPMIEPTIKAEAAPAIQPAKAIKKGKAKR